MSQEYLLDRVGAVHVFRHQEPIVRADGEGAQIEQLVMERAECNAIVHEVRSAGLEPLDVRCVETNGHRSEAKI